MNKTVRRVVAFCILTCLLLSGCSRANVSSEADHLKGHQALIPADSQKSSPTPEYSGSTDAADDSKVDTVVSETQHNSFDVNDYLVAQKADQNSIPDEEDETLDLFEAAEDSEKQNISLSEGAQPENTADLSSEDGFGEDSLLSNVTEDSSIIASSDESLISSQTEDAGLSTEEDGQSATPGVQADTINKPMANDADKDHSKTAGYTGTGPVNTLFDDTGNLFDYSTFHFDKDTIDELAPTINMEFSELIGDNGDYSFPEGYPEAGTYRVVVDLYHQVVMVFTQDEDGKYTVPVRYMLCSSGADSSPSPCGTYKMRAYRVRFGLFKNTESYAQYWSLISGRIYFHTILYSQRDGATYDTTYKELGNNVSHGCIRLTVPDARWIWYHCAPGTVVEIRKGSKKEKEIAKIRERLILADYPEKRLKLKAGKIPSTDNWSVGDIPHDVEFVQGSQQ